MPCFLNICVIMTRLLIHIDINLIMYIFCQNVHFIFLNCI